MFQACVESVLALVALWCAGKRLLFSFSQHRHDISCIGSSEKIVHTASHAYVVHLLNLVAERLVPGSVNS